MSTNRYLAECSDEAKQIAASMDPNSSLELTLLTMRCHGRQIELSNLWIEACYHHINTVILPKLKADTQNALPQATD